MTHSFPTPRSSDLRIFRSTKSRWSPQEAIVHPPRPLFPMFHRTHWRIAKISRPSKRPDSQRKVPLTVRSEEHTSELQSLMRISYAVFCLKKKKTQVNHTQHTQKRPQTITNR